MVWIILTAVVITFLVIAIIVGIVVSSKQGRGDYGDGGGMHIGSSQTTSFFAPANDKAGVRGESYANSHLKYILRKDEYLLSNVLLPLKNGETVEIDSILISKKGLFCIEIKNWVGSVFGSDDMNKWMQKYDDPRMNDRYHPNPVRQNAFHCKILKEVLGNEYRPVNIVLFVNSETDLYINSKHALGLQQFVNIYRDLDDDYFNEYDIDILFRKLLPYVASSEELEKHKIETRNRLN